MPFSNPQCQTRVGISAQASCVEYKTGKMLLEHLPGLVQSLGVQQQKDEELLE